MNYWAAVLGVLALGCSSETSASSTNPSVKAALQQYVGPALCAKREQCGTLASNGYADKQTCIDTYSRQAGELAPDDSVKGNCSTDALKACADKYATATCAADGTSDAAATDDCVPCGFPKGK